MNNNNIFLLNKKSNLLNKKYKTQERLIDNKIKKYKLNYRKNIKDNLNNNTSNIIKFAPNVYQLMSIPILFTKYRYFFNCNHNKNFYCLYKFLHNNLINNESKEQFLLYFYRFQKTINGFKKLIKLWKLKKKYLYYTNSTDFKGCELTEYKSHLVISLIENDTIYKFNILELLKIWSNSLRERTFIIENPQSFKNPYTNINFSMHNLYNIYFKALFNGINIPLFVHMFYNVNFNINELLCKYSSQLREEALKDYIYNSELELYYELTCIYNDYNQQLPFLNVSDDYSIDFKKYQLNKYKNLIVAYCYISYSNNSFLLSMYNKKMMHLINEHRKQNGYTAIYL